MQEIRTHKDLLVWQRSIDLVVSIYEVTRSFPQSELFSLTSQIRRCATSIPANIAEGSGRRTANELVQFLHIALGSATELDTFLIIANNLNFIDADTFQQLDNDLAEIRRMLIGLLNSLKNKTDKP